MNQTELDNHFESFHSALKAKDWPTAEHELLLYETLWVQLHDKQQISDGAGGITYRSPEVLRDLFERAKASAVNADGNVDALFFDRPHHA